MNFENLANNLRILRKEKDISATNLSIELNLISERRIYDIENNKATKVTDEEVAQIANYFKKTVDELLNKKATIVFT